MISYETKIALLSIGLQKFWQPMSEFDGSIPSHYLVYGQHEECDRSEIRVCYEVYWSDSSQAFYVVSTGKKIVDVTHWMPLPMHPRDDLVSKPNDHNTGPKTPIMDE